MGKGSEEDETREECLTIEQVLDSKGPPDKLPSYWRTQSMKRHTALTASCRYGGSLLPNNNTDEKDPFCPIPAHLCGAKVLTIASHAKLVNTVPDSLEEPLVRVMVTQSRPIVASVQLNNVAVFNMVDSELTEDCLQALDSCNHFLARSNASENTIQAIQVQGAGPHFCPGGNLAPRQRLGQTGFSQIPYTGFISLVKVRSPHVPVTAALHGMVLGGGCGLAMNTDIRLADTNHTWSLGNLSRGMVPCMFMSKTLGTTMGLWHAMEMYLADSIFSSSASLSLNITSEVCSSIPNTKLGAFKLAEKEAEEDFIDFFGGNVREED